mgnify:CR=1 FL=1
MKVRTSVLDNKTIVFEVEHGDTGPIVERLNIEPNGFAIMGEAVLMPVAVVDGRQMDEEWFTSDHLLAIEAHELGHIRMDSVEEPVAEREGIRLLDAAGFTTAAGLLRERGVI